MRYRYAVFATENTLIWEDNWKLLLLLRDPPVNWKHERKASNPLLLIYNSCEILPGKRRAPCKARYKRSLVANGLQCDDAALLHRPIHNDGLSLFMRNHNQQVHTCDAALLAICCVPILKRNKEGITGKKKDIRLMQDNTGLENKRVVVCLDQGLTKLRLISTLCTLRTCTCPLPLDRLYFQQMIHCRLVWREYLHVPYMYTLVQNNARNDQHLQFKRIEGTAIQWMNIFLVFAGGNPTKWLEVNFRREYGSSHWKWIQTRFDE